MRVTTIPEDNGLAESTYEFISGTDTESQDENYTGSISESVGSLDFHRPDDVHSLAGTEHTNDDESIADEYEPLSQPPHHNEEEAHDTTILHTPQPHQSWASVVEDGIKHDDEAESGSDDEARSRCSLEYTQQSLKAPSIPTPEASGIVEKPAQGAAVNQSNNNNRRPRPGHDGWYTGLRKQQAWIREVFMEHIHSALPAFVFGLIILGLIPVIYSPQPYDAAPHNPAATSVLTTHPTSLSLSTSRTSSATRALSTSTGAAGLVPLENVLTEEWLFSSRKSELTVSKKNGGFILHIPQTVKESWLKRECLHFSAKRGEKDVCLNTSSTNEGMLLKFPYDESHGIVKVDIFTTCRPRIRNILRVNLDKGIMEDALDRTMALAHDIGELVPAAAQEAERRLEEAKRSLEAASDNVMTASDSVIKNFGTRFHNAHRSLGWIKEDIRGRIVDTGCGISRTAEDMADKAMQRLLRAQVVQQQAQMRLLDAQISARLWWLRATGSKDEHDRYKLKAKEYVARKQAEAAPKAKAKMAGGKNDQKEDVRSPLWTKIFGSV